MHAPVGAWHHVVVSTHSHAASASTAWLLWLVVVFIGSVELAWWFFWNVLNA